MKKKFTRDLGRTSFSVFLKNTLVQHDVYQLHYVPLCVPIFSYETRKRMHAKACTR